MTSRFLQIQIYNERQTQVVYDNRIDTNWGIDVGSASLSGTLMTEELRYGEVHASMFQVKLFGIDDNIDKRLIKVFLIMGESDSGVQIFNGYIDSSKKDTYGIYRDVVAYDWFYNYRDLDVADWWNDFWDGFRAEDTVLATQDNKIIKTQADIVGGDQLIRIRKSQKCLKELKDSLFDYLLNLDITRGLDNISYSETGIDIDFTGFDLMPISTLTTHVAQMKLENVLTALGQLYACTFHIWGDGVIRPIRLWDSNDSAIPYYNNLEGANSEWEDYKTDVITGVEVYDESDCFKYLWNGNANAYKIVGNILLLNASDETLSYLQYLYSVLRYHTYRYTPCNINLIESEVISSLGLGSAIQLDEDGEVISYIMNTTLSGSLLINQNIQCFALGKTLSNELTTYNDSYITATKIGLIEQDAERFRVDYEDFADETETTMEIMAGKYVLQVRNDGTVARVKMGIDDQGDSNFEISADNLNFIANNIMQLAANNIGINAKNFSINPDTGEVIVNGKIIAKIGTIGGFNISSTTNRGTTAKGGHYYANSLYVHTDDGTYEYEIGIEGGNSSPTSAGFYVYRITKGDTWDVATGRVEKIYQLRKDGKLYAQDTEVDELAFRDKMSMYSYTPSSTYPEVKHTILYSYNNGGYLGYRMKGFDDNVILDVPFYDDLPRSIYKFKLFGQCRINNYSLTGDYGDIGTTIQSYWNIIPTVSSSDGVIEIGKIIDFHMTASHTSDYSFRLTNNADGQLIASGTITQGSSRKIKENIEEIPVEEAEKILDLNPVKFDYIDGMKDRRGFIAEDVAEVLPNLVTPEEEDIPASLDYNGIIPYLVKMVQKQQQEIDELKRRLGDG